MNKPLPKVKNCCRNSKILFALSYIDMYLEIISPGKQIYKGEVKLVSLPGKMSAFEVLKNHAPIISTLTKGVIRIVEEGGNEKSFQVSGGVMENKENRIVVLVNGQ